jgi:hypothetical protein
VTGWTEFSSRDIESIWGTVARGDMNDFRYGSGGGWALLLAGLIVLQSYIALHPSPANPNQRRDMPLLFQWAHY